MAGAGGGVATGAAVGEAKGVGVATTGAAPRDVWTGRAAGAGRCAAGVARAVGIGVGGGSGVAVGVGDGARLKRSGITPGSVCGRCEGTTTGLGLDVGASWARASGAASVAAARPHSQPVLSLPAFTAFS